VEFFSYPFPRKFHEASRFTDSQIIAVIKQAETGTPVPELCREHGISSATFYRWRSKFGGMDASLMSQLKELQGENRHLKKMYAESQMTAEVLHEAMKKMVRPSQRREMAKWAVANKAQSTRHACQAFEVRQTCYRYQVKAAKKTCGLLICLSG